MRNRFAAVPRLPGRNTHKWEQMVDRYKRLVQPEIYYCYNCQPYDGGDPVWVLGDETDLEDVFDSYEVPEELRDDVASRLKCRNCGTELERGGCYWASGLTCSAIRP